MLKGEPENLVEVNKKLLQISLKPQEVEAGIELYDDHGLLKDAPTSDVTTRMWNATPEFMAEEENINARAVDKMRRAKSESGGWDESIAESDPDEEPVCTHVEQSMVTPKEIETYTQSRFWPRLAVGMVTSWWNKLTGGRKCREALERYGWMLGVAVVTVSTALVGWWIQGAGQVPEGFVRRGSPRWFRSRLHNGRRG